MKIVSCNVAFLLFLAVEYSFQDCKNDDVVFSNILKEYNIRSTPSNNMKKCKYTFTVPMYFVPRLFLSNINLNGDNKIVLKQYSDYGGQKTYTYGREDQGEDIFWNISPTNFTLNIDLEDRSSNDSFVILISVKDSTPSSGGLNFTVNKDSGLLIDSGSIPGNSSSAQVSTGSNANETDKYSIQVVAFNEGEVTYDVMKNIHVYDGIVFKGSLYDVLVSTKISQACYGSSFTIVNSNYGFVGVYTILISGKTEWTGQIFAVSSPSTNSTVSFSATNGLTVFHEITNPYAGSATPTTFQNFQFRGDGILEIYAGCVNSRQENRRIATVTSSDFSNYDFLQIFGRCRTYVLSQGVVSWFKFDAYQSNYKHKIGRKGVIMSDSYPMVNTGTSYSRNGLIQQPDESTQIAVDYEIAHISTKTTVKIRQDIKAGVYKTQLFTQSDNGSNITISPSYQQYLEYDIPNQSDGVLIRYTVRKSAGLVSYTIYLFTFLVTIFITL